MKGPRRRRVALAMALALTVASCGRKGPPSGGPPDIESPRLVEATPDSGAANVPLDVIPSLTFSEGMEPRSTSDAIALAPLVDIRSLRWSGRTVRAELAEPLRAHQTYTLIVGFGARDRHGNTMAEGASVVFTTGDSFPPGRIGGRLEAKGFSAGSTYLWCYDEARHHRPDSTGRDFDALGLVRSDGRFGVPGLQVPAQYRLWVFADINAYRSFEPATDLLVESDTTLTLSAAAPVADSLILRIVNPRAPAHVKGTVLDSLAEREGNVMVIAIADSDSTVRVVTPVADQREFNLEVPPGRWSVRAFRDLDKNRFPDPLESQSLPVQYRLDPAAEETGVVLVLQRARGSPR
jgi:predicted small lipoprotein YifL